MLERNASLLVNDSMQISHKGINAHWDKGMRCKLFENEDFCERPTCVTLRRAEESLQVSRATATETK